MKRFLNGRSVLVPLAVLVTLALPLAAAKWSHTGLADTSREVAGDVFPFDCFSRPGIATSILQRETQRCYCEYIELRDIDWYARLAPPAPPPKAGDGGFRSTFSIPPSLSSTGARLTTAVKKLEDLDGMVTQLGRDLDTKLMVIYSATSQPSRFLDCYLSILAKPLDGRDVDLQTQWALQCSQKCGRTAEVVDALQHFIRFHSDLKCVNTVRNILRDWQDQAASEAPAANQ
jgi:hypothetical protein